MLKILIKVVGAIEPFTLITLSNFILLNQVAQPLLLIGDLMVKDLAAECTLIIQGFALRRYYRLKCLLVRTQSAT